MYIQFLFIFIPVVVILVHQPYKQAHQTWSFNYTFPQIINLQQGFNKEPLISLTHTHTHTFSFIINRKQKNVFAFVKYAPKGRKHKRSTI